MDSLEIQNIQEIFDRFSLKPDFEIRLQKDTEIADGYEKNLENFIQEAFKKTN